MYYKDILPYKLTPELMDRGWESAESGVFIPWPYCMKDGEWFLALQRRSTKRGTAYMYILTNNKDNRYTDVNAFGRDRPPLNDYHGEGNTIWGLTPPYMDLIGCIINNCRSKNHKEAREYAEEIFDLLEQEDCLYILKDPAYEGDFEEYEKLRSKVKESFSTRYKVGKARQNLAKFLKIRFDVILRKNTHDIYIRDDETENYTQVTLDELHILVSKELGNELINDDDLEWSLKYISDRRDPEYNIVRFKNCMFDMGLMETIQPEKPPFTLIESHYNYNPEAKSVKLKDFLYSSLKKSKDDETEKNVKCIKQLVGYLFTSGNRLNVLPLIIGTSGGGKSVFANILTAIFGKDRIADLKLQQIEKDPHATSSLINKHLNIIQDSDDSSIKNNSLIKQLTGNDPMQVNPKYLNPFVLPPEEVPKSILIGNNIPDFNRLEEALVERFLIIVFGVKFRGTDDENPNLLNEILNNPEEIEWFIYESLKEYKAMLYNGEDFALRRDGIETRKLVNKHQHPLKYIVNDLIECHSYKYNGYLYTQDLQEVMKYYAKEEGMDLILNYDGNIPHKQLLDVIRNEFDLWHLDYNTATHDGKRYYPNLKPNAAYEQILKNKLDNGGNE